MAEKTVPAIQKENPVTQRENTRNPEFFLTPLVDIFETPEGLVVVADLPGVDKEGLNIQIEEDLLTIEGKVPPRRKESLIVQEFEPANFFRQFELPEAINRNGIAAELKNGVLTLKLPKQEAVKPRQIPITVG